MEFYYATTRSKFAEGKQFRNPTMFSGAVNEATKVYIVGSYPEVASAYHKLGVPIVQLALNDPRLRSSAPIKAPAPPPTEKAEVTDEQRSTVEIPSDWETMPWADLRRLAASLSNAPVPSRAKAQAIVEQELQRRKG
jgi:hypothetical protein